VVAMRECPPSSMGQCRFRPRMRPRERRRQILARGQPPWV
jgi:hypothetical protein